MSTTYAVRAIDLTFQLGEGSFGAGGEDTLTLRGLRATVQIELASLPNPGLANIRVWGMTLDHINKLSRAGLVYQSRQNLVLVSAGDAASGMSTVFKGQIYEAYPDFSSPGDPSFVVFATPSNELQLKPVEPSGFPGATKASLVFERLAQQAGLSLENNGVDTVLASPYFPGTVWQQINACARAVNCFAHVDSAAGVLAIWPKTGSRNSGDTPVISPENGMIGYPAFQNVQMTVRTLFSGNLSTLSSGKKFICRSQLTAANGTWVVIAVTLNLSSQLSDGPWEAIISASPGEQNNSADYAYLGAQDQSTNMTDINASQFLVDQRLAQVRTSMPVKIMKPPYDADGNPITPGSAAPIGYVDVQPLVNQIDGRGQATPHSTVSRLSYHRYQGGNGAFITDPVAGDIGQMMVADRDTSAVRATNAQASPGSRRKFDMADGTYVGCSQGNAPDRRAAFTESGFVITVKEGEAVTIHGDLHVTGAVIAGHGGGDQVGLQTHTHAQGNDGHGDTEQETVKPTAGT